MPSDQVRALRPDARERQQHVRGRTAASPPYSSTVRRAMSWIVRAFGSWNVQARDQRVDLRLASAPPPRPACGAAANSRAGDGQRRLVARADGDDAGDEDLEDGRVPLVGQLEQGRLRERGRRLPQLSIASATSNGRFRGRRCFAGMAGSSMAEPCKSWAGWWAGGRTHPVGPSSEARRKLCLPDLEYLPGVSMDAEAFFDRLHSQFYVHFPCYALRQRGRPRVPGRDRRRRVHVAGAADRRRPDPPLPRRPGDRRGGRPGGRRPANPAGAQGGPRHVTHDGVRCASPASRSTAATRSGC